MSIVVHEVAHGVTALWQGDETAKRAGRLTLNPISHIDPLGSIVIPLICILFPGGLILGWAKPVRFNPYNLRNKRFGEALVAVAGPLSNILIALIAGLYLRFAGDTTPIYMIGLLQATVVINLVLAVFNLVPLPPLDGSKILYSLFPERFGRFVAHFERFGLIFTLLFIFLFIQVLDPIIIFLYKVIVGV
jgi:Zn-dependent protease